MLETAVGLGRECEAVAVVLRKGKLATRGLVEEGEGSRIAKTRAHREILFYACAVVERMRVMVEGLPIRAIAVEVEAGSKNVNVEVVRHRLDYLVKRRRP